MALTQVFAVVLMAVAVRGQYGYGHGGYGHAAVAVQPVVATAVKPVVPVAHGGYGQHHAVDYYAHPQYKFNYAVSDHYTGDDKNQWEERDGDNVRGQYSLMEPDGTRRIVDYWVDGYSGFNAVVHKEGKAVHPSHGGYAPAVAVKPVVPVVAGYGGHGGYGYHG